MSAVINVHEAKTHLSRLLDRGAAGEEITLAKAEKPYAKLVPIAPPEKPKRVPGRFKGLISYTDDAFAPLTDEELKDWGL